MVFKKKKKINIQDAMDIPEIPSNEIPVPRYTGPSTIPQAVNHTTPTGLEKDIADIKERIGRMEQGAETPPPLSPQQTQVIRFDDALEVIAKTINTSEDPVSAFYTVQFEIIRRIQ